MSVVFLPSLLFFFSSFQRVIMCSSASSLRRFSAEYDRRSLSCMGVFVPCTCTCNNIQVLFFFVLSIIEPQPTLTLTTHHLHPPYPPNPSNRSRARAMLYAFAPSWPLSWRLGREFWLALQPLRLLRRCLRARRAKW